MSPAKKKAPPIEGPRIVLNEFVRFEIRIRDRNALKGVRGRRKIPEDLDARVAAVTLDRMIRASRAQLARKKKRRGGTGRLREAIGDPNNWEIRGSSIRLFDPEYLDEQVPYWRAIDQGSDAAVREGRILPGFFTYGAEIRSLGTGTSDRFKYFYRNMAGAAAAMYKAGVRGRPFAVISNPIEPEGFVDAAYAAFEKADADRIALSVIRKFQRELRGG